MLATDNDIAVGCDSEIERTKFGIGDQPKGLRGRAWIEGQYGVIAFSVGADSGCEEQAPITTVRKSAGEGHDSWRQHILWSCIKIGRQRDDCAGAAQTDEIPSIRAEYTTARIQAFNPAGVPNNAPIRRDR